ncbi:MAG: glycosyl transferase, partial [Firmicutes bacterium]|nr:glycosyl transferase [Bacillota bacterium]
GYKLRVVALQVLGLLLFYLLPFLALPFVRGTDQILAGVAALAAVLLQGGICWGMGVSVLYALTQPLGATLFIYLLLRSTVVTLWRGGVEWRGTFYPLAELRKGMV